MGYKIVRVPTDGERITIKNGILHVPVNPIIAFIEGEGSGIDIWAATVRVLDAAVKSAYNGDRKIAWMELFAGQKAKTIYATESFLPEETLEALKEFLVAMKGPMTLSTGNGGCSMNALLHNHLDLYSCLRPVRYYTGLPSPLKKPQDVNFAVFRENLEDIYSGIEFESGSASSMILKSFLGEQGVLKRVRFPESAAYCIKSVSREGSRRLIRSAVRYAIENHKPSVTIVHKGDIMKLTEGNFARWGYELIKEEFSNETISWEECGGNPPAGKILINNVIADIFLQQILVRPAEYHVIAAMNLNGNYISDVASAMVGGIGIAPSARINFEMGHALFEATHGIIPKYAGLDKVNPMSEILSGAMMLQYLGWNEAASKIESAIEKTIIQKKVTYDLARFIDGATQVKCSEFADALIRNM